VVRADRDDLDPRGRVVDHRGVVRVAVCRGGGDGVCGGVPYLEKKYLAGHWMGPS